MIIEFVGTFIGSVLATFGPILVWPCIFLVIKWAVKEGMEEVLARRTEGSVKEKKDGEKKKYESGTMVVVPMIFLIVYTYYLLYNVLYILSHLK